VRLFLSTQKFYILSPPKFFMTQSIIVLGFYKYVKLKSVDTLADNLRAISKDLDLKGNILLANEGINASISGTRQSISQLKRYLTYKKKVRRWI